MHKRRTVSPLGVKVGEHRLRFMFAVGLLAPFVASFIVGYFFLQTLTQYSVMHGSAETTVNLSQRLEPLAGTINTLFQNSSADILLMGQLVSDQQANPIANKKVLQKEFRSFLEHKSVYTELAFVDNDGTEQFNAVSSEDQQTLSSQVLTQIVSNGWGKYKMLEAGEVGVSDVTLETVGGTLKNSGTATSPSYSPVLAYVTPTVDSSGQKSGALVLIVSVTSYFDDVRYFLRNGERAILIDQNGNYLANNQQSKEFGNIVGTQASFSVDYPSIAQKILKSAGSETFEWENKTYTYTNLYPMLGSYATSTGAERIYGNNAEFDRRWILVGVTDMIGKETNKARTISYVCLMMIATSLFVSLSSIGAVVAFRTHRLRGGTK